MKTWSTEIHTVMKWTFATSEILGYLEYKFTQSEKVFLALGRCFCQKINKNKH